MICKLCCCDKNPVKSHIIPETFFIELNTSGESSKLISSDPTKYPKKSPIGPYDERILCNDCERKFDAYDDYGIRFIRGLSNNSNYIVLDGSIQGIRETDFDYKKLKIFFLSVLLRASWSSHDFYSHVSLGVKHEKQLVDLFYRDFSFGLNDYSVMVFKFDSPPKDIAMLGPRRKRIDGINCYSFYFGGFHILIKVCNQNFPKEILPFLLSPERELIIPYSRYKGSKFYDLLASVAISQKTKVFS